MKRYLAALASAALLLLGACEETSSGNVLSIEATGAVAAQLFFDSNGNGGADQADRPLEGWLVQLRQPAGGVVAGDVTDALGFAIMDQVPVGRLVPSVAEEALGDTLSLIENSARPFTLVAQQQVGVTPTVTLPFFTIAQARDLSPETPVFVEGIALNVFPTEDERDLHLKSGSNYIRVLSVDSGGVVLGDSVRVRGRTGVFEGVPVLDGKAVYRLTTSPAPIPVTLTTEEAAGALGGVLDAALVRVFDAEILEVVDRGTNGVNVVVDDGTGPLTIHFRRFLDVDPDAIDADTDRLLGAIGLLVPARIDGVVVWELQPRLVGEVVFVRIAE